jgi:hypothetical protein
MLGSVNVRVDLLEAVRTRAFPSGAVPHYGSILEPFRLGQSGPAGRRHPPAPNSRGAPMEDPLPYQDVDIPGIDGVRGPRGGVEQHVEGQQEGHVLHAALLDHLPLHHHSTWSRTTTQRPRQAERFPLSTGTWRFL